MEPAPALPQRQFSDLYTAVYELINDAKTNYDVLKLYKGSHGSPDPHEIVTDFGKWFYQNRRGLISFVCSLSRPGHKLAHYTQGKIKVT